jgi:ABC-type glycerol-3-phosphate transport system substrate-binding protein
MRKSIWFLLSMILIASMVLAACGPAPAETEPADQPAANTNDQPVPTAAAAGELEGTLNVWSFTNEIRTMGIAFEARHPKVDVVYTMIPMTNGEYQTKVKAAAGTADSPDVVARCCL